MMTVRSTIKLVSTRKQYPGHEKKQKYKRSAGSFKIQQLKLQLWRDKIIKEKRKKKKEKCMHQY